ncbi:MAG TPA: methyltransferase domain-containing protein [Gemmatimonadaceae bacterium]|nr:methyltransferase domain-containing protein [Gemmatimonadaceae bacterium]
MTHAAVELADLTGAELVEALETRFDTSTDDVDTGPRTFSILRPRNSDDLIREEDFVKDERLPYWADVWPSSVILAAHLVSLAEGRKERRPGKGLELGCGVGLVTTAAMIAGYEMTATDYYTDALAFTRANAWRATGETPDAMMIDWRSFPPDMGGFDIIFASDVLYEKEYAHLLPRIFKGALAPGGMVILADPGRMGVPEFIEECAAAGMVIRSKITHPFEAGTIQQSIDLYEIADVRS